MNVSPPLASSLHWAAVYIGMPYEPGGRGPERVDCWGLVCLAYRQHFGIELPLHLGVSLDPPSLEAARVIKQAIAQEWREVVVPLDGCAVAMGHQEEIHHIGLYAAVDSGRVVHCLNRKLVIADTIRALKIRGMRTIKFYQYGLHHY